MAKSENSSADRSRIVSEEISRFNKLVHGHHKLLSAIGEL